MPRSLLRLAILGIFVIGIVIAAGSFGLFGCACNSVEQYRQDPPSYTPRTDPA
jgi:hypothetical protein